MDLGVKNTTFREKRRHPWKKGCNDKFGVYNWFLQECFGLNFANFGLYIANFDIAFLLELFYCKYI